MFFVSLLSWFLPSYFEGLHSVVKYLVTTVSNSILDKIFVTIQVYYKSPRIVAFFLPLHVVSTPSATLFRDLLHVDTLNKRRSLSKLHKKYPSDSQSNKFSPILVLDLDETLIHSSLGIGNGSHDFMVLDADNRRYIKIYKRPFVDIFLQIISQYYELVLFTASHACYCDPIIDIIDKNHVIKKRLYNTSLIYNEYGGYEKDLCLVSQAQFPRKILMIDNAPVLNKFQADNLYLIPDWLADNPTDYELFALLPLLIALCQDGVYDMRAIFYRKEKFADESIILQ
eukprot:gene2697-5310_t